jgi:two-component system OmpR family response regulator
MRVLIVEDEDALRNQLQEQLRAEGYAVDTAADGQDGLFMGREYPFDVAVVDLGLPKLNGVDVIKTLRDEGKTYPILVLTARGRWQDKVEGLEAGADDYLVKPFAFAELLARLDALSRRADGDGAETTLCVGDLKVDLLARSVERAGKRLDLQPREFRLLEYLMRHAGQVVTRTMLLENVWDYHFDPQTNVIDVHVSRLRSKIDKGFDTPMLHTVRGAGYRLKAGD